MPLKLPRLLKFAIAGGVAALANFVSRIALNEFMSYLASIVCAYIIGMATAFLLNRLFVFTDSSNSFRSQAMWFVAVNMMAVLQTILISLLFAKVIFPWAKMDFHPETVAHAIGVAVPILSSYVGHSRFSFKGHS